MSSEDHTPVRRLMEETDMKRLDSPAPHTRRGLRRSRVVTSAVPGHTHTLTQLSRQPGTPDSSTWQLHGIAPWHGAQGPAPLTYAAR